MPGSHWIVCQNGPLVSNCDNEPWYIGEFEIVDGHGAEKVVVNLTGRSDRCEVISCRFDVPLKNLVKWQNNPLLSRQVGSIVLTPAGIMGHKEAR